MKKSQAQSITTLQVSPDEDRRKRMKQYSIAMSVRMVCVILCFFVPGWWLLVCAIGAIVLPYLAVVLANNGSRVAPSRIQPPAGVVAVREPQGDNR